jgi:4-alpha-glucanotransferase
MMTQSTHTHQSTDYDDTFLCQKDLKNYKQYIKKALKTLEKDNLGIIVHGSSFPASSGTDTGFGSHISQDAIDFMQFIHELGFNCLQLGPAGKTKIIDPSPYTSTIYSDNPLFIDLYALTTAEYGKILSSETYQQIVNNNKNRNQGYLNYQYAYKTNDKALREAWNNFNYTEFLSQEDRTVIEIKRNRFFTFCENEKVWLDRDALYEALSKIYNNDYWPVWEGPKSHIDKGLIKLLHSTNPEERETAETRQREIEKHPEYEFYKFIQFIIHEQKEKTKTLSPINTIADIQVTYSDRDVWAYQELFLQDYRLGVPPDFFSKNGQAWGFPVINPELIYEKDEKGNIIKENDKAVLGPAGQLIKTRFDKMFKENPGGVRIDHILGLIDPWVYPQNAKSAKASAGGIRLFSSPEAEEPFKSWAKVPIDAIDQEMNPEKEHKVLMEALDKEAIDRYAEIIDIIIQSAQDNNVSLCNIICEDLGSLTNPTIAVLEDRKLSGMRVTQFVDPEMEDHIYRGSNVTPQHWIVPGTHDNDTLLSWVETQANDYVKHIEYLQEDLNLSQHEINTQKDTLQYLVKLKFTELFTSPAKNIQISFMDVFGMKERYNNPGASSKEEGEKNWMLRVPNNYKDYYFRQIASGQGLNLAEILAKTFEAKGEEFINKHKELYQKLQLCSCALKNCLQSSEK